MSSPMDSVELTPEPINISPAEHEEVQTALQELGLQFTFKNQQQLRAVQDFLRLQERKKTKTALWKEYLDCAIEEYKEEGVYEDMSIVLDNMCIISGWI